MTLDMGEVLIAGVRDSRILNEPIPPATEVEVRQLEATIGFDLPADYREFLLTVNGGRANTDIMGHLAVKVVPLMDPTSDTSEVFDVSYLYTLFDGLPEMLDSIQAEVLDLYYNHDSFSSMSSAGYPHVPKNCLPIADASGSGYYLLVLAGANKHKVLYYGYNYYEDPLELYDNVRLAGSNFTDFVDSLFEI